jgi:ABC-type sugar transport system permease subunit
MSTVLSKARGRLRPLATFSEDVPRIALRLFGLAIIDAFGLWFIYQAIADGVWFLVAVVGFITFGINVIFLKENLYPLRWLSPGIALTILMVVYPLIFTVYTAFTNYSDTHLLTKQQAIRTIEKEQYLPAGARTYRWAAYQSPEGNIALCLIAEDGRMFLVYLNGEIEEITEGDFPVDALKFDEDGFLQNIENFDRLSRVEIVQKIDDLAELEFGRPPNTIHIHSLNEAAQYQQKFVYDDSQDAIVDQEEGFVYYAREGAFTSQDDKTLRPGYQTVTGWINFQRILTSPALQGPLLRVFLWTIAFAILSVLTCFSLGLFLALVFNDPIIPGRKLIRSFLLIPYAVPFFISILIWRGMFNPHVGVINKILETLIGWSPAWLSDPWWAKIAILLINLWLGFPYMMLITTGALQSIPSDLFEAAEVDGASAWQRFWYLTLPLLLISVGPLLIFSFAFNFNNFNVIYLFNRGGPPMPNTPTPAGHTDILISYSFRLAFEGGRGGNYGYAAAITIIIFIVLMIITLLQFRYARLWEEVSENV